MAALPTRGGGLDHLVLGVRDLDAAGAFFQTLGFQVGGRNVHPWGTHNRIVQFPGTFLELITVAEPDLIPAHAPARFSFGAFVRDALARGEGFSMLALASDDALADNAAFAANGIGDFQPFSFERSATRADGTTVRVGFTLAFAINALVADFGFFVCQQHHPQNFWNASFQTHPNGAIGVTSVIMSADHPPDHLEFFTRFAAGAVPRSAPDRLDIKLPRGSIEVLRPPLAQEAYGISQAKTGLAGFTVSVADLAALVTRLGSAHVPHVRYGDRVIVPASSAHGMTIAFEQAEHKQA